MLDLSSKVALVTGATSGIGRQTALAFAAAGARVAVVGRNAEAGADVVAAIAADGGDAAFITADIADEAAVAAMVEQTVARFGRLDVAFNNAGWEGRLHPIAGHPTEDFDRMIAIKLRGAFLCLKYQLPQIRAAGGGAVVNMAGTWAQIGFPGAAAYVAAAHGVLGLTRTAALEEARNGIRVNAVGPGAVETPLLDRMTGGDKALQAAFGQSTALGRLARPADVAAAVLYLCSAEASYVTGTMLMLDGGGALPG